MALQRHLDNLAKELRCPIWCGRGAWCGCGRGAEWRRRRRQALLSLAARPEAHPALLHCSLCTLSLPVARLPCCHYFCM